MTPAFAFLDNRALIAVEGPDWRSLLQGLISNDVETLAPGQMRYAAMLTPQGRVVCDMFVLAGEGGCWLDVPRDARDDMVRRLLLYRLRAKATITAADGRVCALWGAQEAPDGWREDPRLPALGFRGVDQTPPRDVLSADEEAYDAWRLELGVPDLRRESQGETVFYAIEADFDLLNGIDFKKGCYIGQEVTSRMKRRGGIRSRMLPIVFEGPSPAPGAEVLAGELRAGEVLSGRDGRAIALLRLDRIEGAALTVEGRPVAAAAPDWLARSRPA